MPEYVASCFISYNHADAELARGIASALQAKNYFVWIDEGQLKVGDSLIQSIGDAIDQVDFLVALVSSGSIQSNWCQKELALAMTGEINNHGISVLPCRVGNVAMPPSLSDKLYLEVSRADTASAAAELDRHMKLHLSPAEAIPKRRAKPAAAQSASSKSLWWDIPSKPKFDPRVGVKMLGVDLNGVTQPTMDGTPGSGLYRVPITIEPAPDYEWDQLFVHHFNHPTTFTSMHRPGIASVEGDRIVLDGTTMEELERYHVATLKLAVEAANSGRRQQVERAEAEALRAQQARESQRSANADIASRLKFD